MCGAISYNKKSALSYDTDVPPNNLWCLNVCADTHECHSLDCRKVDCSSDTLIRELKYWLGHQVSWLRMFKVLLSSPCRCQTVTQFYFKFSLNLHFRLKNADIAGLNSELIPIQNESHQWGFHLASHLILFRWTLTLPFHCNFWKDTVPDLRNFCSQNLMTVWYFFSLLRVYFSLVIPFIHLVAHVTSDMSI
jgi:hypothetical protein